MIRTFARDSPGSPAIWRMQKGDSIRITQTCRLRASEPGPEPATRAIRPMTSCVLPYREETSSHVVARFTFSRGFSLDVPVPGAFSVL